jgi:hypothetical protein
MPRDTNPRRSSSRATPPLAPRRAPPTLWQPHGTRTRVGGSREDAWKSEEESREARQEACAQDRRGSVAFAGREDHARLRCRATKRYAFESGCFATTSDDRKCSARAPSIARRCSSRSQPAHVQNRRDREGGDLGSTWARPDRLVTRSRAAGPSERKPGWKPAGQQPGWWRTRWKLSGGRGVRAAAGNNRPAGPGSGGDRAWKPNRPERPAGGAGDRPARPPGKPADNRAWKPGRPPGRPMGQGGRRGGRPPGGGGRKGGGGGSSR